jgi:hypothetical protein
LDHVTLVLIVETGNRLSTIFNLISLCRKKITPSKKNQPLKTPFTNNQQHPYPSSSSQSSQISYQLTVSHKNLMCFTGVLIEQIKNPLDLKLATN